LFFQNKKNKGKISAKEKEKEVILGVKGRKRKASKGKGTKFITARFNFRKSERRKKRVGERGRKKFRTKRRSRR